MTAFYPPYPYQLHKKSNLVDISPLVEKTKLQAATVFTCICNESKKFSQTKSTPRTKTQTLNKTYHNLREKLYHVHKCQNSIKL